MFDQSTHHLGDPQAGEGVLAWRVWGRMASVIAESGRGVKTPWTLIPR